MGDAGPPSPLVRTQPPSPATDRFPHDQQQTRDIHILVTGFGPFKSFTTNPSWLIASALPSHLDPLAPSPPTSSTQGSLSQPRQTQQQTQPNPIFGLLRRVSGQSQPQPPIPEPPQQPLRPPNTTPYKIHIHTYPSPVRVAYDPTSVLVPSLLDPRTNSSAFSSSISFDYVLHIGLASGRDSYTLETCAHRSGYHISDVDDLTGDLAIAPWKKLGVPERLEVGWEPQDVLRRWEGEVTKRQTQTQTQTQGKTVDTQSQIRTQNTMRSGQLVPAPTVEDSQSQVQARGVRDWMATHGMLRPLSAYADSPSQSTPTQTSKPPRKAVVKLSRDAGRFLCEFILECSLVYRYLQAQPRQAQQDQNQNQEEGGQHLSSTFQPYAHAARDSNNSDNDTNNDNTTETAREKQGKVAFLHVPNGIEDADVARGVMVAESAIRAVIASWEDGYRNVNIYAVEKGVGGGDGRGDGGVVGSGFESRETGDR